MINIIKNPKFLIILVVAVIGGELAWMFFGSSLMNFGNKSLDQYAQEVFEACANSEQHRPVCYEEKIPKLMDNISMVDAFKVTRIVQDLDPDYTYCHVLAHKLSAREVQRDPENWKDVVSMCPTSMCSNGCLHGGFQEKFRAEFFSEEEMRKIIPDLVTLCEKRGAWEPTGLEQASCYHALGHLTMYLTNAEINRSMDICDEVALKEGGRDYRQLCYDGAFMQIFQPLEPEDFALIEGKEIDKSEYESFCSGFDGMKEGSCRSEGWPLFLKELYNPSELVKFCSKSGSESETNRCYGALIYVLAAQFKLNSDKIFNYCSGLPEPVSGRCFANSASRMIEVDARNIDRSVDLCRRGSKFDKNNQCYKELVFYSSYTFRAGSEDFLKLCNTLPSPWNEECFGKNKR
jgi:hypothetical protein